MWSPSGSFCKSMSVRFSAPSRCKQESMHLFLAPRGLQPHSVWSGFSEPLDRGENYQSKDDIPSRLIRIVSSGILPRAFRSPSGILGQTGLNVDSTLYAGGSQFLPMMMLASLMELLHLHIIIGGGLIMESPGDCCFCCLMLAASWWVVSQPRKLISILMNGLLGLHGQPDDNEMASPKWHWLLVVLFGGQESSYD